MFRNTTPAVRSITTSSAAAETCRIFEKALELIGHRIRTVNPSPGTIVVEGGSSYGLQKIQLKIDIHELNNGSSQVRITAGFRDFSDKGAQRCIDRLIHAFHVFQSGRPAEKKSLTEQSTFKLKTGVSKLHITGLILIFTSAVSAFLFLLSKFF